MYNTKLKFKHLAFQTTFINKVICEIIKNRIFDPLKGFISEIEVSSKTNKIYGILWDAERPVRVLNETVEKDIKKIHKNKYANNDLEYRFQYLIKGEWYTMR